MPQENFFKTVFHSNSIVPTSSEGFGGLRLTPDTKAQKSVCSFKTCTQTIVGRSLSYGRILDIIQNEEYLEVTNIDNTRRRSPRSPNPEALIDTISPSIPSTITFPYDPNWKIAKISLVGFLTGLAYNLRNDGGSPSILNSIENPRPSRSPDPNSYINFLRKVPPGFPKPGQKGMLHSAPFQHF